MKSVVEGIFGVLMLFVAGNVFTSLYKTVKVQTEAINRIQTTNILVDNN